jgi:5-methylthioadenosine/S-adenosylhomocysteine deaminase
MNKLIRKARYVVRSATRVEKDSDVLIRGDHISAVGQDLLPPGETTEDLEVIDAQKHAVIPGLVNAHTHLYQSLLRGLQDNLRLEEWIQRIIFPYHSVIRKSDGGDEADVCAARLGCAEMLKNGTTSFIDMDNTNPAVWAAWQEIGIRGITAVVCADLGLPEDLQQSQNSLKDRVLSALEAYRSFENSGRTLGFMLAPEPGMCSRELLGWAALVANSHELRVHVHAAEIADNVHIMQEKYGLSPIGLLHSFGLLSHRTSLAHCVHVSEDDISILSRSGAIVVHCPKSNMKLGSGAAPVSEFLSAGIPVALANDGPASNDLLDMFEEMRAASFLNHLVGRSTKFGACEVFQMATEQGAKACGIDAGTIDPGKLADLTLINLDRPHLSPDLDIVPLLVYCGKGCDVDMVIVNGEIVVEDGKIVRVSEAEIVQKGHDLREALKPLFHYA